MDVILHLLDAFDYFKGYAEQLVIDQDSLMVSDENYGEVIYTKSFDYFILYGYSKNNPLDKSHCFCKNPFYGEPA